MVPLRPFAMALAWLEVVVIVPLAAIFNFQDLFEMAGNPHIMATDRSGRPDPDIAPEGTRSGLDDGSPGTVGGDANIEVADGSAHLDPCFGADGLQKGQGRQDESSHQGYDHEAVLFFEFGVHGVILSFSYRSCPNHCRSDARKPHWQPLKKSKLLYLFGLTIF
jgi:hypothetical protein